MKNSSKKLINGAVVLIFANIFAKFLGAIYRIPLSNILGAEGIGVYQMAFPVYSFLLIIATGGLPLALSKLVSEARAEKNNHKVSKLFSCSLLICLILATLFSLFFFSFGDYIAILQGNTKVTLSYNAVAGAVFFACISGCFKGYFQGKQNMVPTAISTCLEQLFKLVFGLFLAYWFLPKGIEYAVFGTVLGIALGEFFSFLFLLVTALLEKKPKIKNIYNKNVLKPIVKTALPITLAAMIFPFCTLFDSFAVVNILKTYLSQSTATALYGLQTGMINPIVNFPSIITMSVGITLLPSLCFGYKNKKDMSKTIKGTFMFVFAFILPCAVGFILIAKPILFALYPNAITTQNFPVANILLIISAFGLIFISLAQTSTTVLQANNKSYKPVINLLISSVVKIILTTILLFVPSLNIFGLAIANLVFNIVYFILNRISVLKQKITLNMFGFCLKIIFSVCIMTICVVITMGLLENIGLLICVVISIFVGIIIYAIMLFAFGILNKNLLKATKKIAKQNK